MPVFRADISAVLIGFKFRKTFVHRMEETYLSAVKCRGILRSRNEYQINNKTMALASTLDSKRGWFGNSSKNMKEDFIISVVRPKTGIWKFLRFVEL